MSSTLAVRIVSAAKIPLVCTVMVARSVSTPGSNTVHRLRTAAGGALLVVVAVRAPSTIVGCVLSDLVGSAAQVSVVSTVIVTTSIGTK